MRLGSCPRERELGQALSRGHWPQACSDELHTHVAACRSCRELVVVRQAFVTTGATRDGGCHRKPDARDTVRSAVGGGILR